jgi:hypothetical protein
MREGVAALSDHGDITLILADGIRRLGSAWSGRTTHAVVLASIGQQLHVGCVGSASVLSAWSLGVGSSGRWAIETAQPFGGMALGDGMQFIRSGNLLHAVRGAREPGRRGIPLKPEPDASLPALGGRAGAGAAWLLAGPFGRWREGMDHLKSIGGTTAARPKEGTKVKWEGATFVFRQMGSLESGDTHSPRGTLDVGDLVGLGTKATVYAYTVLDNSRQRLVAYECMHPSCSLEGGGHTLSAEAWVGGMPVSAGDRILLPKGRVSLMLRIQLEQWGTQPARMLLWPRVVTVEPALAAPAGDGKGPHSLPSGRTVLP